jgi:acetoin:2,6-dichlorophenolindophenol oxidoreductase subunit beta
MIQARSLTQIEAIREALCQEMERDARVLVIGLGVDDPKTILGSTRGLAERFGPDRVLDTPLSEDGMTGACIGMAMAGLRPVHVHIRVDFLMLAMNQIVNVAAKTRYMSGGQQAVPLVVRAIIGRSWGQGAQHSQALHSMFMHVPGLKVVAPSTPLDAKGALTCAIRDDNPVIFIEHRMLHGFTSAVPSGEVLRGPGSCRVLRRGGDLTLVGISYMVPECLRAAEWLSTVGIECEVLDPVWLSPLDVEGINASVEIRSRLEEIVEFAEVGEYLDTPVKRYSSGMYVRLAFAVAAHLEPEILLVDEVLAVGDVMFQRKCIGKMSDVARGGRTVLFVSHNMGSVSRLCTSAVLLEAGRIVMRGSVDDVVGRYLTVDASSGATDLAAVHDRSGDGRARFTRAVTRNAAGDECDSFTIGDDIRFDLELQFHEPVREGRMSLQITSASGIPVYHLVAVDSDFPLLKLEDRVALRVTLRDQRLYPGAYFVSLYIADSGYEALDRIPLAFKFTVTAGGRLVTRELDGASAAVHEIAEWERLA